MGATEPTTNLPAKTILNMLRRLFKEEDVDRIARETGLMKRKREITPLALLVACLSTLGVSKVQWLADILRTFNRFTGKGVRYKPFHNQLSKPGFALFLQEMVCVALEVSKGGETDRARTGQNDPAIAAVKVTARSTNLGALWGRPNCPLPARLFMPHSPFFGRRASLPAVSPVVDFDTSRLR